MSMQHLFRIIDLYRDKSGLSEGTISTRVFNHGARIEQMRKGSSPRISTLDAALGWFSTHWPADLDWPADIPRPDPVTDSSVQHEHVVGA